MRKAADLLKKLIVQIDTGNIIGNVADLLIDPEEDRLVAVLTVTARWLREPALIPWEQIIVSTGDVILVQPGTEPILAAASPRLQHLLERKIHVSGTAVLTKSGAKVGTVGELMINDHGQILGYVVSSGFLGSERQFVAAENVEALGADALIILEGSTRDVLPTGEAEELADELKHSIVLPLTGTRLTVDSPPAGSDHSHSAEIEPAVEPAMALATAQAAAEQPSGEIPASPEPPDSVAELPPAVGVTKHLTTAEIDAILRGDRAIPADESKTDFE